MLEWVSKGDSGFDEKVADFLDEYLDTKTIQDENGRIVYMIDITPGDNPSESCIKIDLGVWGTLNTIKIPYMEWFELDVIKNPVTGLYTVLLGEKGFERIYNKYPKEVENSFLEVFID